MSKKIKKKKTQSRSSSSSKGGRSKSSRPVQQKIDFEEKKPKKEQEVKKAKKKKEHTALKSATPYILILFGVILLICFFTVQILGMDEGAGILGYGIQYFFCGLFGVAAFLIPFVLFYVGVKWCLYNINKKDFGRSEEEQEDLARYRKRNILQTVMAILLVIFVSVLVGVWADEFTDFEIAEMYAEAGENLAGGGIIGSSIALLMIKGFEAVISSVVVITILVFIVILMLGLTPDRIVVYFRNRGQQRREEKLAEMEAAMLLEEKARREEMKHKNRLNVKQQEDEPVKEDKRSSKRIKAMSVDEMIDDEEEIDSEGAVIGEEAEMKEIYIGPSRDNDDAVKAPLKENDEKASEELIGEDFGGDPIFDNSEFKGLSGIIENLKSADDAADKKEVAEELDIGLITEEELLSDIAAVAPDEEAEEEEVEIEAPYVFPPYDLLNMNPNTVEEDYQDELRENAQVLIDTLKSFKVGIKEVTYSRGPTITRYELKPEVGTRVRSIANLVDDIALNLATSGVRIEAPIPNKAAVGIEVPNKVRATVYLRDLIENSKFIESKSRLTASLGMDVGGNPIYFDVAKMPHLLIAGTTGSGKSICINSIIISILYKARPHDVKLILIDPKKVEFNMYKTIPHLYCPIVSEPKKAAGALASAVAEMERRFELIESVGVRDIAGYNSAIENDPEKEYMPQMVIIIDELADLMMTARDEVETSICRLAQKARAAGIHLILGTQRPSVDVITGLIKANVPSRIACTVNSQVDSRTIIDVAGAENLIGRGDMLFAPVGSSKPMRVQGAFVSDSEVEGVVTFISENNGKAKYNNDFINRIEEEAAKCGMGKKGANSDSYDSDGGSDVEGGDSKFSEAVKLAIEEGKISTSLMQRRLGVGYGRAAKIIDTMEQMGYVSKPDGNKPRRVLITMDEYMRRMMDDDLGGE